MNFDDYKNLIEYPKRPERDNKLLRPIGELLESGVSVDDLKKLQQEYDSALSKYKKDKETYQEEGCRLHDLFRKDALEETELDFDEEIADKAFSYAWQEGHSSGYSDVYYCLSEIADLIILAYKKGKASSCECKNN